MIDLQKELALKKEELTTYLPTSFQETIRASILEWKKKRIQSKAIKTGSWAPNFVLSSPNGELISLDYLLSEGPVVLVFYQGGWNPYCNIQLKALQAAWQDFQTLGAQLVAISPESPEYGLTTFLAHRLSFSILNDQDNQVAQRFGISLTIPKPLQLIYENLGIDLIQQNRNAAYELPAPATYVIDQQGKIAFSFVEEDFSQRADISDILEALYQLKGSPVIAA